MQGYFYLDLTEEATVTKVADGVAIEVDDKQVELDDFQAEVLMKSLEEFYG